STHVPPDRSRIVAEPLPDDCAVRMRIWKTDRDRLYRCSLARNDTMPEWRVPMAALLFLGAVFAAAPIHAQPQQGASTGRVGISPRFAEELYRQVTALREADGCHITRFDTRDAQILIGLEARSGAQHDVEVTAARARRDNPRRVGDWALAVP